jgi:hypothetical protein
LASGREQEETDCFTQWTILDLSLSSFLDRTKHLFVCITQKIGKELEDKEGDLIESGKQFAS